METLILLAFVILLVWYIKTKFSKAATSSSPSKRYKTKSMATAPSDSITPTYAYEKKTLLMTNAEARFYRALEQSVEGQYYIFPQIHLSSLLEHRLKNGQSWKGALSKIQRKSIDYVLCDKNFRILLAVELDDFSHTQADRIERDAYVKDLFKSVNLPFVRFRTNELWAPEQIRNQIMPYLDGKRQGIRSEIT